MSITLAELQILVAEFKSNNLLFRGYPVSSVEVSIADQIDTEMTLGIRLDFSSPNYGTDAEKLIRAVQHQSPFALASCDDENHLIGVLRGERDVSWEIFDDSVDLN